MQLKHLLKNYILMFSMLYVIWLCYQLVAYGYKIIQARVLLKQIHGNPYCSKFNLLIYEWVAECADI